MKLLLCDLDGTLTVPWTTEILPGVIARLNGLCNDGARIAIVTNQGGVGYRRYTGDEKYPTLQDVLERMNEIAGILPVDRIYVALHHGRDEWPSYSDADSVIVDGRDEPYCIASWRPDWGKPMPGMLRQACDDFGVNLSDCLVIGDRDTDRVAGYEFRAAREFFAPERFCAARERARLTQKATAELLGVDMRTIQRWEGYESIIPYHALRLLELETEKPYISAGLLRELLTDAGVDTTLSRAKAITEGAEMTPEEQAAFCWAMFH